MVSTKSAGYFAAVQHGANPVELKISINTVSQPPRQRELCEDKRDYWRIQSRNH